MKRTYNLTPQAEDTRDLMLEAKEAVKLPRKVNLRANCPPVFDQGSLGSCTANAGAAAYMMLKDIDTELSRLFLYYQERLLEGKTDEDAGATMRSVGKALHKYGICIETLWPYVISNFDDDPPDKADNDAATRKISAYKRLIGVQAIKRYLAEKSLPVMIGIKIYESFESPAVESTGIIPLPDTGREKLLGGHAVLIVGYDDDFGKNSQGRSILSRLIDWLTGKKKDGGGYFIVRNSWGTGWGDGGYFYLPYSYVSKGNAFDAWIIE